MSLNLNVREYLAHVFRISHIFSLTLDVDEVLRCVMDDVIVAKGAERGFLLQYDADGTTGASIL